MHSDLTEKSDEEILRLSQRDPSAFEVLVNRYQDAFVRKARGVMRNEEDAEDVVQETFTKIYLHAASFQKQEGASFTSWAYKILLNTSFTLYQKRKRERGARMEIDPEVFQTMPDHTSREFERYSLTDYVASVTSRMSDDLARALQKHFLDGLPQADIAEAEGVSVGAIKTRVHRAKKAFRDVDQTLT